MRLTKLALVVSAVFLASQAVAQQTVGLFLNEDDASPGYTLFGTLASTQTHLVDIDGKLINQWTSAYPTGNTVYLLPGGRLMRCSRYAPMIFPDFNAGGTGGRIEVWDWDGNLVWDYVYSTATFRHHHDVAPMPNGNVLLVAWEYKTGAEAIQAGRDPGILPDGDLWPEKIVEVEPVGATGGNIVWEWHVWDHLIQDFDPTKDNFGVVADHPELVDINFLNGEVGQADWLHANAIDYNPERDEILLGIPFLDEIWVIDHSTTTAEAAGHTGGNSGKGGDLLYRYGNPQSYGRGTDADRKFFNQHDAEWIDAGLPGAHNILVFNNGPGRPAGTFSSIDEIEPPRELDGSYSDPGVAAYGPAAPTWSYTAPVPTDFFAGFLSGSQRLPNGNTLIANGPVGNIFEVKTTGEKVWDYVNPVNMSGGPIMQGAIPGSNRVFRADRYTADGPALIGQDLTPGDPLELFNAPLPVPDGTGGSSPLVASRIDPSGDVRVEWDVATCTSFDYNLLYGSLGSVGTYALDGSECGIGTTGSHDWLGVPGGDLYFLVVGTDDTAVYESSLGADSSGDERRGGTASTECTATSKILSSSCP